MFIDKDSVYIDNISMGQYLVDCKFGYNKLWSDDSGRNMAGKQSGTLIGIFPKLIMQFKPLTKAELNLLAPHFNSANQTCTYYDPDLNTNKTITTYTGDWELLCRNINQTDGFSLSFIAVEAR